MLKNKYCKHFNISYTNIIIHNIELNNLSFNKHILSIFSLNISSLYNKLDDITVLTNQLKYKFQVIILIETRKVNVADIKNLIPDYELVYIKPTLNKCGGILIWVYNQFAVINRQELVIRDKVIDNICLELQEVELNKKFILSVIYRHPNPSNIAINEFKKTLKICHHGR
jgi:hypothetical protein